MVAALAAPVEVDPGEVLLDRAADLVAAGLKSWVMDAARFRASPSSVPSRDWERCHDAWELLQRRPDGSPLVDLAAQLGDVDAEQVWESLRRAVLEVARPVK